MFKKPLVTVLIPNYNHSKYLDERINTVLNQTYKDFEVIILDDRSTDNSLEIINKYKDNPHVSQIVVNEKNSGSPFIQWNKGFNLAKGDLIWIAESDDSCESTFLETLIAEFFHENSLAFAFCRSILLTEEGEKKHVLQGMFHSNMLFSGKDFIQNYLIWGCLVYNASSVLFRKSYALSVDSLFTTFRAAGDWLFWIEMAEKGNVAVISNPLNYYRAFGDNTTSRTRLNGIADNEDKRIYEYIKSHGYLSWFKDLRIQKKYVKSIKYENKYEDESIRKRSLLLWNPNLLVQFMASISFLFKYLKRKIR
jgi:glycosyltransferase involved in cell wall biosynthesis